VDDRTRFRAWQVALPPLRPGRIFPRVPNRSPGRRIDADPARILTLSTGSPSGSAESSSGPSKVVRDPLWDTIPLDSTAVSLIDAPEFQRLRHIRQLGLAYLVYPGANHSRFDHAIGVHHLVNRTLRALEDAGELTGISTEERRLVSYAGLLHDIGHYPFSHTLEELESGSIPGMHEELAGRFLMKSALRDPLTAVAADGPERVEALIRGRSESPLQGLVSGSLDLDKIEYLKRDAMFCGVPYGEIDVDRLIGSMRLLRDPDTGALELGIAEKGLAALESLLFAKYQMFRNVYWHHTVRAATALLKRLAEDAVGGGLLDPEELVGLSDEGLLSLLEGRGDASGDASGRVRELWLPALRGRRLPKRALELPGEALRSSPAEGWLYHDTALRGAMEARLAGELDLDAHGVFLDYPEKPAMMALGLLVRHADGEVRRLTSEGRAGLIGLPRLAGDLYRTARVFRVFTVERRALSAERMLELLRLEPEELRTRLESSHPLL
jgi:uncharacterized protein